MAKLEPVEELEDLLICDPVDPRWTCLVISYGTEFEWDECRGWVQQVPDPCEG